MSDRDDDARKVALARQLRDAADRYRAHTIERESANAWKERLDEPGTWRTFEDAGRVKQRLLFAKRDDVVDYLEKHDRPPRVTAVLGRRSSGLEALLPGGNQLISSYYLIKGESARRTVARVLTAKGQPRGSGFLVSPVLLMTNNHVLPNIRVARNSTAQFDFVASPREHSIPAQTHRLDPDAFFLTNSKLDYTIVGVQPESIELQDMSEAEGADNAQVRIAGATITRGWNRLIDKSGKALVGEPVNIIQHPQGRRQQIALRDNEIVGLAGSRIHYRADTQRGSSGSPVWSDDWNLVALHSAGIGPRNANGEIITRDNEPWDMRVETEDQVNWIANEGVRISEIVAHLKRARAELDDERKEMLDACFRSPSEARRLRDAYEIFSKMADTDIFDAPGDDDGNEPYKFGGTAPDGPNDDDSEEKRASELEEDFRAWRRFDALRRER